MKKRGAQQLSLVGMPKATKSMPTGPPTEAEKLRDIAATAPMRIMAPMRGVEGITSTGQFKTQHETGTAGPQATLNPEARASYEDRAFGEGKRPVYGYFSHGDERDVLMPSVDEPKRYDTVSGYGHASFELKEHMRKHTTYAWGDSLGGAGNEITKQGAISEPLALEDANTARVLPSAFSRADSFYTEMHVHKPPTLADVSKAIVYESDQRPVYSQVSRYDTHAQELAATEGHLQAAGVPHEVRKVGTGGQQVLPLEHEDWGDAHWSKVGPGHSGKKIDDKAGWQPGRYGYYTPADEQRAMSTTKRTWKPGAS